MRDRELKAASRLAILYLLLAVVWFVVSGGVLRLMTLDAATAARLHSLAGWLFVLLTGAWLFVRLGREGARRAQVEKAAREREAQSRSLVEGSSEALLLTATGGRVLAANPVACRMFGMAEAEICQREWSGLAESEDRRLADALAELARTGRFAGALRFRRKDGSAFEGEVSAAVFAGQGGAPRTSLAICDITARIRMEQALRALSRFNQGILDGLTAHICVLDENGMIVAVNRAWRGFAAANPPSAAKTDVGADYFAVCEAATGEEAVMARETVRGLRAVLRGELAEFSFEYPCHSSETQRWFLLQAARLADESHPRIVVAHVNITERKQAEEALQAAHALLEGRVQERTAELAQTVDDLRREVDRRREAERILRGQALQLRALTAELTLAEQRERQRLAQLLHDGLQQWLVAARLRVARLGRFQYPDVPESCRDIAALLEQAIESSRSLSAELSPPILYTGGFLPALEWLARWMRETHHLTVALQVGASVGGMDESTTLLLFQAVRELLFNVVKHAGVQEAVVEVAQPDGQVCVTVIDQGKGFDPAQAPAGASSGLGLASIRRRLEYLGGTLEITSTAGEGSRFTLTVPLNPNDPPPLDACRS